MTVKARITCENRPGRYSTYAFNCRRAQLRTEQEEGERLVSRLLLSMVSYIASGVGTHLSVAEKAWLREASVRVVRRSTYLNLSAAVALSCPV